MQSWLWYWQARDVYLSLPWCRQPDPTQQCCSERRLRPPVFAALSAAARGQETELNRKLPAGSLLQIGQAQGC